MATLLSKAPAAKVDEPRTPTLSAKQITRIFGDGDEQLTVLDSISLELYPGEFTLLMGPAGSGKSTLLAILSGLLRPTSGQVICLGEDLWSLGDKERERFRLRHCGFVFQEYNLLPSLNARQQLEIMLRWGEGASAKEAKSRAEDLLARLDLSRKARLMPLQLSGGEKQRVAIGRGLIKNPAFCFADEPTAALDWQRGEQVISLLRHAAHDLGATVFVTAHDERIAAHADRVLYLEDGRLRDADLAEIVGSGMQSIPRILP
jgi:putative ABC transport system ATP-binding protein